uniref:acetyl-CoA hydrolase/transferase C-terminal domain-containing protein n=1 Tax=Flavobacterium sp. TaxID=239 RepID=UPI0040484910
GVTTLYLDKLAEDFIRSHGAEPAFLVEVNVPIFAHDVTPFTAEEEKIGAFVASLIENKSTLQMGIGSIPNAALSKLTNHKDLGLHTEMFSDGVIDLIENDVINCNYKGTLRGRALATFLMGSKRLYDFVNDNPFIEMKESSMVNDTARIRRNPRMVAINSAIEVDVTGQVCADSIGSAMYSGVGGQMDFIRGASLSEGGKAIIALPSITKRGESRIVPYLKQGAGVVTTRAHVHYIITENGIADLYGKTLKQRVSELVKIAHPSHQEAVDRAYYEMTGCHK